MITNVGKDLRLKLFLVAVRSDILMRDLGENLNSFIQLIDSRGAASTGGRDGTVGSEIIRRCITYSIGQQ